MPIYEYTCNACKEAFEKLVFSTTVVVCPACASPDVRKKMSTFGMGGGEKPSAGPSRSGAGCGSCSKGSCSTCH
ncbi:MAG: zinc ribbon domain-containing protein [Nitrospiraceae bacterium]|nr:zinc ribbon domain-containing protein [Nitrospiraceae bacterium]